MGSDASLVHCTLSMHKALGSIPSTTQNELMHSLTNKYTMASTQVNRPSWGSGSLST